MTDDPFDLGRFVEAQDRVYPTVLAELRAGAKRSHWIWFVFPQLRGLGHSATAQRFGISSLAEARAYLDHPVLGPRLRECAGLLVAVDGRSATRDPRLSRRSQGALVDDVVRARRARIEVFRAVLDAFYDGQEDPATLALLA